MSRGVKRTIIALLVLIGLLIAADYAVASVAEHQVSQKMRQKLALTEDPSVTVRGFPFSVQALRGDYEEVVVSAERLTVGPLREVGAQAVLHHVRIPLSDLLSSGDKTLRVDETIGAARINGTDLGRQLPGVTKLGIEALTPKELAQEAAQASDPASISSLDPATIAKLVATVSVLGQEQTVSAIVVLVLNGQQIVIEPRDIRVGDGGITLPQSVQATLRNLFTVRLNPGTLPFKVTPTNVRAIDGVLEVSGIARNLVIGGVGDNAANLGR